MSTNYNRLMHHVSGRLSLRPPQADSLARLVQALTAAPEMLGKERDVAAILSTLKAEFPTLEDFDREFPSLCFALATGVGKTRLAHLVHDLFTPCSRHQQFLCAGSQPHYLQQIDSRLYAQHPQVCI